MPEPVQCPNGDWQEEGGGWRALYVDKQRVAIIMPRGDVFDAFKLIPMRTWLGTYSTMGDAAQGAIDHLSVIIP